MGETPPLEEVAPGHKVRCYMRLPETKDLWGEVQRADWHFFGDEILTDMAPELGAQAGRVGVWRRVQRDSHDLADHFDAIAHVAAALREVRGVDDVACRYVLAVQGQGRTAGKRDRSDRSDDAARTRRSALPPFARRGVVAGLALIHLSAPTRPY